MRRISIRLLPKRRAAIGVRKILPRLAGGAGVPGGPVVNFRQPNEPPDIWCDILLAHFDIFLFLEHQLKFIRTGSRCL